MRYFGYGIGFSEQHKELGRIIRDKDRFEEAKQMFLSFHSSLNFEADKLLKELAPQEWTIMPTVKDETIAWSIWHITRIEDLTVGILVGGDRQIFDQQQKEKLNVAIVDTGNALSDDEIMNLSESINIHSLLDYRAAVIKRTQNIVRELSTNDMRRKVSPDGIEKIRAEGGVTAQEESVWLLDYWGKKDVAGILLMPPTRHTLIHLNDCERWKEHISAGKKVFRTN
ncbi:MAG: DinB family protein [Synergistaceae bacterium]|jgi:hypothetical protein|nr:DinB family protein [Synergistaceae bacterium]